MSSRTKSLLELAISYIVAILVGILAYRFTNVESLILRVLMADVLATLVIWIHGLLRKNSSVYDPYWSVIPPIILVLVAWDLSVTLTTPSQLVIFGVSLWAIRLTYNWFIGWTDFSEQDWRYTMIKQKSPKLWSISNLFGIMMMPTLIVFIQLISTIQVFQLSASANAFTFIGFLMIVVATMIQFIADRQMRKFKERTRGKKAIIQEGLWRFSRHPNYFGEISMWWGVYIIYVGASGRLDWLIVSPILMTALFVFISIPMMEKKILKTRPEYRAYQQRVSMLIPWFSNRSKEAQIISTSHE